MNQYSGEKPKRIKGLKNTLLLNNTLLYQNDANNFTELYKNLIALEFIKILCFKICEEFCFSDTLIPAN